MSVYSELWRLLRPGESAPAGAVTGVVTSVNPVRCAVGESEVGDLTLARGLGLQSRDIGREALLLPCGDSAVLVCLLEGGAES